MTLRALATMHDLPPLWDGDPVTWDAWHSGASSLDFHVPLADLACHHCGLLGSRQIAHGTIHHHPSVTGRIENVAVLFAFRCPGCLHDEVWDRRTDDMWEVDEDDYLAAGSTVREALW